MHFLQSTISASHAFYLVDLLKLEWQLNFFNQLRKNVKFMKFIYFCSFDTLTC